MVDQTKGFDAAAAVKLADEFKKNGGGVPVFEERDENGFLVINNKRALVGKGFMILKFDFELIVKGASSVDIVVVYAVTDDGKAVRFQDSGSGVYKQLANYKGEGPINVPAGLRVSDYQMNGAPASTFYLDFAV